MSYAVVFSVAEHSDIREKGISKLPEETCPSAKLLSQARTILNQTPHIQAAYSGDR